MSEGKKEILLGDCLELMNDIPNGNIDMILADLPYGTTACKWDTIIPFEPLWEQYKRIIKPNGAIVLTASQPFTSVLVMSNLKMFRYELIWDKLKGRQPFLAKIRPMKSHENILVFSKNKTVYNPQMTKAESRNMRDRVKSIKKETAESIYGLQKEYIKDNSLEHLRYPQSVFRYSGQAREINNSRVHPTQKPIELFEYLIKTYTNEGDLVLDNTAGSGTTAIACLRTNRQFIVMEKEQKYYDIILKRVGDFNKKFEPQTLFGNEM